VRQLLVIAIIVCALKTIGFAQNAISICGGGGINKINSASVINKIGNSKCFGLSGDINSRGQSFHFLPSLTISNHNYYSKGDEISILKLKQRVGNLNLLVGIKIAKGTILKSGFFISSLFVNTLALEYIQKRSLGSSGHYSSNDLLKEYYPKQLQPGIIIGLLKSIDKKGKFNLDIQLQQNAVSILKENFFWENSAGDRQLIFSKKSLPMFLTIGLCIKLNVKRYFVKSDEV
jgi:hypothetical protein